MYVAGGKLGAVYGHDEAWNDVSWCWVIRKSIWPNLKFHWQPSWIFPNFLGHNFKLLVSMSIVKLDLEMVFDNVLSNKKVNLAIEGHLEFHQ